MPYLKCEMGVYCLGVDLGVCKMNNNTRRQCEACAKPVCIGCAIDKVSFMGAPKRIFIHTRILESR